MMKPYAFGLCHLFAILAGFLFLRSSSFILRPDHPPAGYSTLAALQITTVALNRGRRVGFNLIFGKIYLLQQDVNKQCQSGVKNSRGFMQGIYSEYYTAVREKIVMPKFVISTHGNIMSQWILMNTCVCACVHTYILIHIYTYTHKLIYKEPKKACM